MTSVDWKTCVKLAPTVQPTTAPTKFPTMIQDTPAPTVAAKIGSTDAPTPYPTMGGKSFLMAAPPPPTPEPTKPPILVGAQGKIVGNIGNVSCATEMLLFVSWEFVQVFSKTTIGQNFVSAVASTLKVRTED